MPPLRRRKKSNDRAVARVHVPPAEEARLVEEYAVRLRAELVGRAVVGCTEKEVAQVEAALGVHLPPPYQAFLLVLGKTDSPLLRDPHGMGYPAVMRLREEMEGDVLSTPFTFPDEALIFSAYEAECRFCMTGGIIDPPVYRWQWPAPAAEFHSDRLSNFLLSLVAEHEDWPRPLTGGWDR